MTQQLIEVPAGLNGVVAADTAIGAVDGDRGFFHYGPYDATMLARTRSFEDVWFLVREGRLPTPSEAARFRAEVASLRTVPSDLAPMVDVVARQDASMLDKLRAGVVGGCERPPIDAGDRRRPRDPA
jgi:citrate synthase